ncbi:hypothetical protein [Haloferax volcanii]|uniref:hypothetical protein n=1 Tax=Haloferax volcanii TaxID=2246 RepID=UPI00385E4AA0
MEITVSLRQGPLDVEFVAEDREQLETDLVEFVGFLNENSEVFDGLESPSRKEELAEGQPGVDSDFWTEKAKQQSEQQEPTPEPQEPDEQTGDSDHPLSNIARKTGVDVKTLDEIVYVDPEGEETPQILIDKSELGDSKSARQRHAAYIILTVWEECYGEERMKNSELKTILSLAGISENHLYNAWSGAGKGNFDPTGRGASATTGLTGPGKREALKFIQELVEEE